MTDVICIDFSKAFDRGHNLLILKLALLWGFRNYSCYSRVIKMSSGELQDSQSGSLLLTLFLYVLLTCAKESDCLMFADDVKIFRSFHCISGTVHLQSDLNKLVEWCQANSMVLNLIMWCMLSFSWSTILPSNYFIGKHKLVNVTRCHDLGVIIDSNLRFNLYIESCVNKLNVSLGFKKRWLREFYDSNGYIRLLSDQFWDMHL